MITLCVLRPFWSPVDLARHTFASRALALLPSRMRPLRFSVMKWLEVFSPFFIYLACMA